MPPAIWDGSSAADALRSQNGVPFSDGTPLNCPQCSSQVLPVPEVNWFKDKCDFCHFWSYWGWMYKAGGVPDIEHFSNAKGQSRRGIRKDSDSYEWLRPEWSKRTQHIVLRFQSFRRSRSFVPPRDQYIEVVVDIDTREFITFKREPLSLHR